MTRPAGPGGTAVLLGAGAAVFAVLFPLGLQHRVRHEWREKECAERLRTLERLTMVRSSQFGSRRSPRPPPGSGRWLILQRSGFVGASDLDLFFCPYQAGPVTAEATDYRGAVRPTWGRDDLPTGADFEDNHPPCCPINVVFPDGTIEPCRPGDPWKLDLRAALGR